MRVLLPVLAGGLVLSLLIWPQIAKRRDFISDVLKSSAVPLNSKAQIDMKKVSFYSQDEKGQPFILTAEKIWEIDPANKVEQIDLPKGKMTLNSGVKLFSDSPLALYYQEKGLIHFKDKIYLNSDNGYQVEASEIYVEYQKQSAYSNNPVSVRGEKIDLDATGFRMRQNGNEIDFLGKTNVVLKKVAKGQNMLVISDGLMEIRQKTQTITFHKNVSLNYDTNKIYCDKMIAYFKSKGKNEYELKSVKAQKKVRIETPNEVITGDDAFYDLVKEKAFITGNVVITRAEGKMQGSRAVVDMKTGLSRLEADNKTKKQRVKGTLYPEKIKK